MTKAEFDEKIAKLKKAIASPATPEAQKKSFQVIIDKLLAKEEELTGGKKAPAAPEKKVEPKKEDEPKKAAPKAEKPKKEKKQPGVYDCDELITKEKERKAKSKAAAAKREAEPKKTPATKNKIAIEKVAERVTANVQKRIDKGEVKRAELEKLIAETKTLLSNLEKALKKL